MMRKGNHLLLVIAQLLPLAVLVSGQSSAGFINIDCGKPKDYTYNDTDSGLIYTSDFQYIDTGEIHTVDNSSIISGFYYSVQSYNLRSFPDGIRNCYTIKPVEKGGRYLVKASFKYGNYDGKNKLPQFDLYLGANLWTNVYLINANIYFISEIVTVSTSDRMSICLINTGSGTPFISALELRPLPSVLYVHATSSQALLQHNGINFGTNKSIGYPSDPYDRFWSTFGNSKFANISNPSQVSIPDAYQPPLEVMQTATYPSSESMLLLTVAFRKEDLPKNPNVHFFLHFAELQQLKSNQTRIINITLNGDTLRDTVNPSYLKTTTVSAIKPINNGKIEIMLQKTDGSTLPPLFNAVEMYFAQDMNASQTDSGDDAALDAIKAAYKVRKDWMGDPCSPTTLMWDGLNCSFDGFTDLRIISLNLSSSGLTGDISTSFANLSRLQYLDLSRNELTGGVPDILANLTHLRFLDLSGNKLNGYIPKVLLDRAAAGNLTLGYDFFSYRVLEGNIITRISQFYIPSCLSFSRNFCNGSDNCRKKSKRVGEVVGVTIASVTFLILVALIIIFKLKKRRNSGSLQIESITGAQIKTASSSFEMPPIQLDKQFTRGDLVKITENFSKEIGKGGFGPVYYGILSNNDEVAVKMLSNSSSQGPREFQTEAHLLTSIHHKNLVYLAGYCNENSNLALIYEYMAEGSLQDHLTGKSSNGLSWVQRLRISAEAAQGLEYLHFGCKPRIIHRDVKTNNILLNKKLEAKISDFGLSRFSQKDDTSYISTRVVGTPGYLDPEYYQTNKLNEKSDVYSFGVVLLEVITGLPAIVKSAGNVSLTQWVKERFERGQITEIIDRRIYGDYDVNSVWKVLETAMACVSEESIQRPTMNEVQVALRDCLEIEATSETNNSSNHMNSSTMLEITPLNMSMTLKPSAR